MRRNAHETASRLHIPLPSNGLAVQLRSIALTVNAEAQRRHNSFTDRLDDADGRQLQPLVGRRPSISKSWWSSAMCSNTIAPATESSFALESAA